MFSPAMVHLLLPLLVAVSILLMLIRPQGISEVYWISGGVLLLVAMRLVPLNPAGRAVGEGLDVYLFLIGIAQGLIVRSVLIGVDLGPNLSVTGSLATILWLLALRKEGLDVSFWRFLKVGILAMPIALLSSLAGAILMQLLLRSDR